MEIMKTTNPRNAGAPKRVKDPVKCTVTFDKSELDALRNYKELTKEPYNELLRRLVRQHFGIETNF